MHFLQRSTNPRFERNSNENVAFSWRRYIVDNSGDHFCMNRSIEELGIPVQAQIVWQISIRRISALGFLTLQQSLSQVIQFRIQ